MSDENEKPRIDESLLLVKTPSKHAEELKRKQILEAEDKALDKKLAGT